MRIASNTALAIGLGAALLQMPAQADDKPTFKDDREKASYSLGMNVGTYIKRNNMDLDVDVMANAIRDMLAGKEPRLTEQQAQETMRTFQQEARKKTAEKNKADGEAFLAENRKKEGIKSLTVTLPTGTNVEMQYKVLTEGTGAIPKSQDIVSVNYRGTLLNGKEFDSTSKRGAPMKRAANQLIRGWTEALQKMKVGSKWEVYIPSALAYGDMGTPAIEPGSTLKFEIELLGVETPPAPAAAAPQAQPLTSDIIKVPSAEELKKGAKIEVIKADDAAKLSKEALDKTNQSK